MAWYEDRIARLTRQEQAQDARFARLLVMLGTVGLAMILILH